MTTLERYRPGSRRLDVQALTGREERPWQRALRRILQRRSAVAGMAILGLLVVGLFGMVVSILRG